MKRLLAILCTLALMLSVINPAVFAAENSSLQAAKDDDSSEIIVLEEDTSDLTVNRDTTIDLNGHSIDGVTVTGGTLYCLDSQTADYTVADGIYGHVTNVTGNVKAAEGYLQVGDSFHAVNLDIYAMTLRASDVGVYYKSNFAADEVVAAQVESFGVALSVVTAPNADNLDTYCGYSVFTGFEAGEGANATGTSTLLKGIMKAANGDNKNAKNAAMPIYGSAYIKTAEGYIFGETVKRSLQEQVEAIDGVWASLTESQKAPVLGMLESYTAVMESWNIPNIRGIQVPGADEEIQIPVNVTAENGIVTEAVTVEQDGVSVTVPAGVKLAEGATALTLTVTPVEAEDTGLTLKEDRVLIPMDVHVEGLAADNAQPITIYLGKIMPENLNMGNYTVYHVENGNANEMTLIPVDAEFTAHNQYKYSLDGELTLYMASFSVIAAEVDEENAWNGTRNYEWYDAEAKTLYIRNADQLAGFGAIVGGMATKANDPTLAADIAEDSFAGKIVMLTADISIGDLDSENGKVFYPIGYYNDYGGYQRVPAVPVNSWFKPFCGTFDGNGNTISDFYQNTWEMFGDYNDGYSGTPNYYREGMGLFGKVYGGTVKNLFVENFSCDSEHGTSGVIASYADCGATFENIAIFNCNPRVYNIGNGGIVGCVGWYARETAEKKVTFTNITVDNSNKISALWDASGTSAGGILGQYYPTSGQSSAGYPANPGVHFKDCRISAILEVNNDCISNYHYYWYRYTGMLLGSVRKNTTNEDGYTVADTTGIEAENCEVSFGYWNEFWYCELVKNSIASYTHDYQFGRLTSITDLSEITNDGGETWLKKGDFALLDEKRDCLDCYHIFEKADGTLYRHFHDQPDETNPNIHESFDLNGNGELDDLKEDRQRYLLPFNQILTGDGMGVLANYKFKGVTVVDSDTTGARESQEKFTAPESYTAVNGELKLSELFAVKDGVNISVGSVQAYISPVGEDSTVQPAACVISDGNWEDGILKIEGLGKAKITITDYWYCVPTVVDVIVKEDYTGDYYIAAYKDADSTYYYMTSDLGSATVKRYQAANAGEKLPASIVAAENSKTFTISKNADGEYIICACGNENGYLAWTVTGENSGALVAQGQAQAVTITPSDLGRVKIQLQSNSERYLSLNNDQDYFAWYKNTQKHNLILVPVDAMGTCLHENTYFADNAQAATCTEKGKEADTICSDCGMTVATGTITDKLPHTEVAIGEAVEATCTTAGITAGVKCSVCETVITKPETIPALGHTDVNPADNTCDTCGVTIESADPELPETSSSFVKTDLAEIKNTDIVVVTMTKDGTTWALTSANGTSSAPTAVVVKVENEKITSEVAEALKWNITNNNGNLTIYPNGTTNAWLYCTSSNNGVRVGTNANKVFTIDATSGYLKNTATSRYVGVYTTNPDWRCYTNTTGNTAGQTLAFYVLEVDGDTEPVCVHANTTETTENATCTEAGSITVTCNDCGEEISKTTLEATGHNYVDGACSVCGETKPTEPGGEETTIKYTFSSYAAGTQYAQGEEHELDDVVTLTINGAHLNGQVRLYAGSNAVFSATKVISSIIVKAGYKEGTLTIYGSTDGNTWNEIATQSTTTTYTEYSFDIPDEYKYVKLEAAGAQIRVSDMTFVVKEN